MISDPAHKQLEFDDTRMLEYPAMRKIISVTAPWIERSLGLLFIVSAASKAVDMTAFAMQVSYYGVVTLPALVRLAAVFTVWLETVLGVALLVGWRLRGWTLRAVFALLVVFTGLILYAWAFKGLQECGCFGRYLQMSPGVSVIKNVVMMALVAAAWFGFRKREPSSVTEEMSLYKKYSAPVMAVLCVAVVFGALAYGQRNQTSTPATPTGPYDKGRPYAQFRFELDGGLWDLGEDEYFVVLLSDTCEHCEEVMFELNDLPLRVPNTPPVVSLFLGEEETLEELVELVEPEYPTFLIDELVFVHLLFLGDGKAPPRFVHVRDGKEVHSWNEELPEDDELMKAFLESNDASSS